MRQFFILNDIKKCLHVKSPPYSSDLELCNLSLFPKHKMKLKGCFFCDIVAMQTTYTRALDPIPQNELEQIFESLLSRWQKFIEAKGAYFE
ncbi:hypothetical protein CEXT_577331 [Caerostris extrusa]|uniref:Transposase n=1 Tax=Caerostris extrusa TaxID=172846 RepID=A0AAV4Y589_CAEEX|nr:hypothetical protein CEXT_577331 [Caerostris extrusa]